MAATVDSLLEKVVDLGNRVLLIPQTPSNIPNSFIHPFIYSFIENRVIAS